MAKTGKMEVGREGTRLGGRLQERGNESFSFMGAVVKVNTFVGYLHSQPRGFLHQETHPSRSYDGLKRRSNGFQTRLLRATGPEVTQDGNQSSSSPSLPARSQNNA